jgi:pentatricopeptide repeat protein
MSRRRPFMLAVVVLAVLSAGCLPGAAQEQAAPGDPSGRPVAEILKDADAAFARQDYAAARALYEQAVRLQPDSAYALGRLARLQSWDNELDASVANYRRALALAPGDFDLRLGLAGVLASKRDYGEAIDLYLALQKTHPDDAGVLLGLGNALAATGRYAEAETIFKDMEDRRIEPVKAHAGRARLRGWQGNLDEAEHFWRDILRADPGNLDARIGMAYVHHWQGLDRTSREQAENILLDHPESQDAKDLKRTIERSLRPRGIADAWRYSDDESNRVDSATLSSTFMAEPQSAIRVAFSTFDASFRCEDPGLCDEPGLASGDEVATHAQELTGMLTTRVIRPLTFNAHLGAIREESFDGGARVIGTLGGYLNWKVGPRFEVGTFGGRDAFLDSAPLIDRGILTTDANARLEYRFRPAWHLTGSAGAMSISDGNAQRTAGAAVEWRPPAAHPRVAGTFDVRYRAFNTDEDNGYFDPQRYDSELVIVALWDDERAGLLYWRLEATFGRQAYTESDVDHTDTVSGGQALFGINFADGKAAFEATYARSNYTLNVAPGLMHSRTACLFRLRF